MVNRNDEQILVAFASLDFIRSLLKPGTREVISKQNLKTLSMMLVKVIEGIKPLDATEANAGLVRMMSLINEADNFDILEADAQLKDLLLVDLDKVKQTCALSIGRYYMVHDIPEDARFDRALETIVTICFESGFYFDMEDFNES